MVGPAHGGKTHLAHIWQETSKATFLTPDLLNTLSRDLTLVQGQAFILEDVETCISEHETTLFHLFNALKENKGSLLITAQEAPKNWGISLKDLASRLSTLPLFSLLDPDDILFLSILTKNFSNHQMHVAPKVLDFLMKTVARTYQNAWELPQILSKESLAQRHSVTIPFLKKVLDIG